MSALSRIAGRPERGRRTPVRVGCWNAPTAGGRFTGARFSVIPWGVGFDMRASRASVSLGWTNSEIVLCVRNALSRVLLPMWDNRAGCCRHGTKGRRRVEEFNAEAKRWMETAKHPRWNRLYTELVYQPMLEVLSYLRNNAFKTYIVTGGGQDFVRVYAERVYGTVRWAISSKAGRGGSGSRYLATTCCVCKRAAVRSRRHAPQIRWWRHTPAMARSVRRSLIRLPGDQQPSERRDCRPDNGSAPVR